MERQRAAGRRRAAPRRSPTTPRTRRCRRSPTRTRAATADGTPLGIVHRDIAPGNILVSLAGEVKLSDFGIVKSNDRVSRTQVGVVKGNANFMSPEQARGQAVDARSDLFSLGLVLYYCLSGEMLYGGHNDLEVPPPRRRRPAAGRLRAHPAAPRSRAADPGAGAGARPARRFQTAAEFADELAVHMGGGRGGAAQLMRELFGDEICAELGIRRSRPPDRRVGYTAGP